MNIPFQFTIVCFVLMAALGAAPGRPNPGSELSGGANTARLLCFDEKTGEAHNFIARSKIISTRDLGNKAYAVVKAEAQERDVGARCLNFPHLFVATRSGEFREVFGSGKSGEQLCINPRDRNTCGINGIRPVQWSNDGRYLLVELVLWIYGSEGFSPVPAIYDSETSLMKPVDADPLVKKRLGANCDFELSTMGFSSAGEIAIEIQPIPREAEERYGYHSCLKRCLRATIDWHRNKLTVLSPELR